MGEDVRPLPRATSRTGASRVSSGGATRSPRGTARTARSRSRARARRSAATAGRRIPTCSTRGSRARSGRSRRSAGPNKTPALAKFYPASDLETGYDILFFWVARMMMFGLHFMKDVPFRRVLLHGLIVDETGDKMSKVKGNVIDPLDLIHGDDVRRDGAEDAARRARGRGAGEVQEGLSVGRAAWARASRRSAPTRCASRSRRYPPQQQAHRARAEAHRGQPALREQDLERERASSLEHLEGYASALSREAPRDARAQGLLQPVDPLAARRRRSRIAHEGIEAFRIDEAANELYRFFWNDFCDWYLEVTKPVLRGARTEDGGEGPRCRRTRRPRRASCSRTCSRRRCACCIR